MSRPTLTTSDVDTHFVRGTKLNDSELVKLPEALPTAMSQKSKKVYEIDEESVVEKKPPAQPTITAFQLKPTVMRLHGRNFKDWTFTEKKELAALMSNRTSIDNSIIEERYPEFNLWYTNFSELMQVDPEVCALSH